MVVKGQADPGCAPSLVCVADWSSSEHEFWYDVIMVRLNRGRSASTGLNPSHGPLVSTYQTRTADYGDVEPTHGEAALAAYAEIYGRVQRKLFAGPSQLVSYLRL